MTVREILSIACKMLSKNDLSDKIENEQELTEEENELVETLINCLNLTQWEICTEYVPIIFKEKISSDDGKFDIAFLSKKLAYILSMKDKYGCNLKYKIHGDMLMFDGEAIIEYCYVPKEVSLDSKLEFVLPERTICFGIIKEYYFSQDFISEASVYEEKFKNSLLIFSRKHSEIKIPKRIWS